MTAKAALCEILLSGKVLNIKNCFTLIGLTNCPREISRMIEQPFGVQVSRTQQTGKSRYGQPVVWIDYRLNKTEYNKEGIEKMREYCKKNISPEPTSMTLTPKPIKNVGNGTIKQDRLFGDL